MGEVCVTAVLNNKTLWTLSEWQTRCSYSQDVCWDNLKEFFVKLRENLSRQMDEWHGLPCQLKVYMLKKGDCVAMSWNWFQESVVFVWKETSYIAYQDLHQHKSSDLWTVFKQQIQEPDLCGSALRFIELYMAVCTTTPLYQWNGVLWDVWWLLWCTKTTWRQCLSNEGNQVSWDSKIISDTHRPLRTSAVKCGSSWTTGSNGGKTGWWSTWFVCDKYTDCHGKHLFR